MELDATPADLSVATSQRRHKEIDRAELECLWESRMKAKFCSLDGESEAMTLYVGTKPGRHEIRSK